MTIIERLYTYWVAYNLRRKIPPDGKILFYKRDRPTFGFLSNFYRMPIYLDGMTWPQTETYYMAQKSFSRQYRRELAKKDSPGWAKGVGDSRIGHEKLHKRSWFRDHPDDLRPDWNDVKDEVMLKAVRAKFSQTAKMRGLLLGTGDAELIEDSPVDAYWGTGPDGKGLNQLGKIHMQVREEIKNSHRW